MCRRVVTSADVWCFKIRVSLSHEDSCYRRYKPRLEPSTKNEIKLYFKLNEELRQDMLLFLLNNPRTVSTPHHRAPSVHVDLC